MADTQVAPEEAQTALDTAEEPQEAQDTAPESAALEGVGEADGAQEVADTQVAPDGAQTALDTAEEPQEAQDTTPESAALEGVGEADGAQESADTQVAPDGAQVCPQVIESARYRVVKGTISGGYVKSEGFNEGDEFFTEHEGEIERLLALGVIEAF